MAWGISLYTLAIMPFMAAGLMYTAHVQTVENKEIEAGMLLEGFRRCFSALLKFVLIRFGFIAAFVGFFYLIGWFGEHALWWQANIASAVIWVFHVVSMYHAPALIINHGIPPWQAFKMNWQGCCSNLLPLLAQGMVYLLALGALILFWVFGIRWIEMLMTAVFGSAQGFFSMPAWWFIFYTISKLMPWFLLANYPGYRNIWTDKPL